jgi:hypothetical protein
MNILILDICGTSTDPKTAVMVEIGAVVYDITNRAIVSAEAYLVHDPKIDEVNEEELALFNINKETIIKNGKPLEDIQVIIQRWLKTAKQVASYSSTTYDLPMIQRYTPDYKHTDNIWINLSSDLPFDKTYQFRHLVYLCAKQGFLNPFGYRALPNALSILRVANTVLDEANMTWSEFIKHANSEEVLVIAGVTYETRQLAKDNGFTWDAKHQVWLRRVKLYQLELGTLKFPFRTTIIPIQVDNE